MLVPFYRINAFIDDDICSNPIRGGNSAAVVILSSAQSSQLSDSDRQSLATELNLSETSFVTCTSNENTFNLRWFTPSAEVSLCGHATLAAAAALRAASLVDEEATITFSTLSGELKVSPSHGSMLSMQFPSLVERDDIADDLRSELLCALNLTEESVTQIFQSKFDIVVEVESQVVLSGIKPNFKQLKNVSGIKRGIIVCSIPLQDDQYSSTTFVSRFFAPAFGIDEDPVTGSAHCALTPMYLQNGQSGVARQLSQRGGKLFVENRGDSVMISGQSFVVIEGSVHL